MAFGKTSKHAKKFKKQTLLIIIRSGSVSFTLVDYHTVEFTKPYILFNKKTAITFASEVDAETFICKTEAVVEKELETFITEAARYFIENELGQIDINDVSVIYSAPWYGVITQDIVIQKEQEFELTEKKFNEIVVEQVKKNNKTDYDIIERHITHVILNGYELTNPFGKKAKELTISIYVSYLEKKCKKGMNEIVEKHTGAKEIHFGTQPLVSFLSLRDLLHMHHSYAQVHVTSETTEFYIIKQGAIAYIAQIPFGKKWIIDSYSKKTKYSAEVALSKIKQFKKGDEEDAVLTSIKKSWVKSFLHLLQDANIQLPNYLYMTGDQDVQHIITNFVQSVETSDAMFSKDARTVVTPLVASQFVDHFEWQNAGTPNTISVDVLSHVYFIKLKHGL